MRLSRRLLSCVCLIAAVSLASYAWLSASGTAAYDPSTERNVSDHVRTTVPKRTAPRRYASLTPQGSNTTAVVPSSPAAAQASEPEPKAKTNVSDAPKKTAAYADENKATDSNAAAPAKGPFKRWKARRAERTAARQESSRAKSPAAPAQAKATAAGGQSDRKWYSWFWPLGDKVDVKALKDNYVPFQTEKTDPNTVGQLPSRPKLLVERGDGFLSTGKLHPGFEVPVLGAVWQPRLWAYAINRTAFQSFDSGRDDAERETEIANRLDLFINLQLTGTEKILLGFRPTDNNRPNRFTRYTFDGAEEGFNDEFSITPETFFFEGDFGSLFPRFDRKGVKPIDFGFTIGRQPLVFQEGILINDTIDAVGIIRNNIPLPGTSNFRVSAIYGWNRTDRNDFNRDPGGEDLFGLFLAADTHVSTWNFDAIYIDDNNNGDGLYFGVAAIQRLKGFGGISTAFRVNTSIALEDEIPGNVIGTGTLITAEISKTPKGSDDIVYFNSFLGIGNFTQAGREAIVGGPLANTGILFASPNLSTYGAELDPFVGDDVIGGAIGYQAFWDNKRRNLILEAAGRYDLSGNGFDSLALGAQLQQAVGQHVQLQFETYYAFNEGRDNGFGARAEVQVVY
ncbi:MAG: hypothetical protein MI824_06815 [Hyphomicrobiales bacterium]|nr:hypothetical protein [Hyphomicrobiales bacterium]